KILARVSSPNAGNPLGFVLPNRTDFQFTFDAEGLTEGLIYGFQTFLNRAVSGTQRVANGFTNQANVQAHLQDAGNLVQAVLAQMMDAASSIPFSSSSLPSSESQSIQDVL